MTTATCVASLLATGACDEAATPPGPPRCEPEPELWVERLLKEGYRALLSGEAEEARRRFERALALEPGHPEALRGLASPPGAPPTPPARASAGEVRVGGDLRPSAVEIVHGRFDFETLRTLAPLRAAQAGPGQAPPSHAWYDSRPGAAGAGDTPEAALSSVDLIVLHDTHTASAAEAFAAFEHSGASTHFLIDADGTIFQTLDLALEANHTRTRPLDARSIAIDLVNPVDIDRPPGAVGRPLSDFVSLQGRPAVQEHGYTRAQLAALEGLLGVLCAMVPAAPCTLPAPDPDGRIPRRAVDAPEALRGVAGHLHVSPLALDPGAGFPWEALRASLRDVP